MLKMAQTILRDIIQYLSNVKLQEKDQMWGNVIKTRIVSDRHGTEGV